MLVAYWTVTTHYDTHYNENLLVMPPTHLWLVGIGLKLIFTARLRPRTVKVLKYYLIGALALIALDLLLKIGPFIQGNYEFITVAALCDGAALLGIRRHFNAHLADASVIPPTAPGDNSPSPHTDDTP
jgi:peptidoglycan/LPS O-acetylase OafA/YrhL